MYTDGYTDIVSTTSRGRPPLVVGFGGTTRSDSSSERALRAALAGAAALGADTELFAARDLELPMYDPGRADRVAVAQRFLNAVAHADGIVIATPGYHGNISGLVKNALDYVEDLRGAHRPYLHGRAVGCIVCAYGWQATTTTLVSLRATIHALRGWPTPLGVTINSATGAFADDGSITDAKVADQLAQVGAQVVQFATGCAPVAAGLTP